MDFIHIAQENNAPDDVLAWANALLDKHADRHDAHDQSRATAHRISETGLHGNTVHCLLSDYGSTGAHRLHRFFPARDRVEAITYNPFSHQLVTTTAHVKERRHHQFSLEYPMRSAAGVAALQH